MPIQNKVDKKLIDSAFSTLVDAMYLLAVGLTRDGIVTYVNQQFLKVTGYERDEILGKNWFDICVPIKKMDTVRKVFDIIVFEKYAMKSENEILTKLGSELTIEWHNYPIVSPGGQVVGTVSIGVDVTGRIEVERQLAVTEENSRVRAEQLQERNRILSDTEKGMLNLLDDAKRLEEELQLEKKSVEKKVIERTMELNQEKARLEASINSVPSGFLVTDKAGTVIIKNNAVHGFFGTTATTDYTLEFLQQQLGESANIMMNYTTCLTERKTITLPEINFGKKIVSIYMAPIFAGASNEDIIGVIILITDITEQKVLERSKDEFFSIASHELRTPITAIRGNIELINKYYAGKLADKNFDEMLNDMRDSSTRLLHLVNEFLNTSRLEQGKMTFNIVSCNLSQLTKEAIAEIEATAISKDIKILFEEPTDFVPTVNADPDKVKEILINLLGNALAYTERGSISVELKPNDTFVECYVTDTGKGIPTQNQKLLFRKFQQANASILARDVSNSTGLGLYISKLLVTAMGGTIALARSEEGVGSTFVFTLPLVRV